ncbi:uncharacterized protein TNCV_1049851 [Trichonephila clavipes]|nr:uncharacterized protein TNCV_1049851 [Trichonephila clavipes]
MAGVPGGQGIESWLACLEFEPSATKDPPFPHRGVAAVAEWYRYRTVACFVTGSSPVPLKIRRVVQQCTLNLSRAEKSSGWCGVVVRRGGCQLRCRPRHLTMVQNYVVRRQKPRATLIFNQSIPIVAVNGDRYRAMITNFFIPEFNNHDVQELWFQQDGATCHTARAIIDLLKDTFGDRLISRFGPVNWPPRSCDLTPLDYFLWGCVKS